MNEKLLYAVGDVRIWSIILLQSVLPFSKKFLDSVVQSYSRRSKNWPHMLIFTFIEQLELKNNK